MTTLPVPDGHSRVDGIALGASGNITDAWTVFANYTYLDSKVKQSVSDACLANPGRLVTTTTGTPPVTTTTNPCGNSSAVLDPQRGDRLIQTPRHSGSLFTTYTLPFGLQLGYGFTYQGSFTLNNSALATPLVAGSSALTPVFKSKSFLTHRAFLSYADQGRADGAGERARTSPTSATSPRSATMAGRRPARSDRRCSACSTASEREAGRART